MEGGGDGDPKGLPKGSVIKLARSSHSGLMLAADVQTFLVSACNEFVGMVGTEANEECNRTGKSIVTPEHVIAALNTLGHGTHADELRSLVEDIGAESKSKRERKNQLASSLTPEERARMQAKLFEEAAEELMREEEEK